MKEESKRRLGAGLAALAVALYASPWLREAASLPDSLHLSTGQTRILRTGLPMRISVSDAAVSALASGAERFGSVALDAVESGEASVTFSLLGVPIHETHVSVAGERRLIPGGQAVGVALHTQGVLVVARDGKWGDGALRVGDVIRAVEGRQVGSAKELGETIGGLNAERVRLEILRDGRELALEVSVPIRDSDGRRHLGVWVRDSTAGVGTLSYIDPKTDAYGALGHAIVDADTGRLLEVRDGAIMDARVIGVTRGASGKAGELHGSFLRENEQIGQLALNSAYGIYGKMTKRPDNLLYPEGLPIGGRSAVHTGEATIITTIDEEGPKEYDVQIVRCFDQNAPSQKGMILRVTDERLLEKTGGIVQGMSGSPILQDGRIVGAVTHVYLSDSAQGYGMYIEWMLEKSDGMDSAQRAAHSFAF